jgi:5'-deoxynucleotidase YfbR-like HD superfamily hydrolase
MMPLPDHTGRLQTVAEFLRASHTSRWSIVQTSVRQNIAEHMYRVWVLVHHWGPLAGLDAQQQTQAEQMALTHDMPEIRSGDAPTPWKTPEFKAYLSEVERRVYPEGAELEEAAPPIVRDLLKFCDTAEAVLFLAVNGLGRHAMDVRLLLNEQLRQRLACSTISDAGQQQLLNALQSAYHDT